ncbi:unnamed protein product, partial [marine sediment metagenome]
PKGSILLLPMAKGKKGEYGSVIEWDIRVHKEGVVGCLPLKIEVVRSLGGLAEEEPEGVVSATKVIKAELESKYPYIQPTVLTEMQRRVMEEIKLVEKVLPPEEVVAKVPEEKPEEKPKEIPPLTVKEEKL